MSALADIEGYRYDGSECGHMHQMLLPVLLEELKKCSDLERSSPKRVFDLGCGNGSVAAALARTGEYEVVGCDPSSEGISTAKKAWPDLKLEAGSGYEDLAARFGGFSVVYSLEVLEHVYDPRLVVQRVKAMLRPGGRFILSTPYHGYLKNLALALTGKMDAHFTALWDHGHIKFWSRKTITHLLEEAGFRVLRIHRLGRVSALAMTMMVVAELPERAS